MTTLKMTEPRPAEPVTLTVGMISGNPDLFDAAEDELTRLYGAVSLLSPIIDFNFTDYYESQMGPSLKRKFISFENEIDPGTLADIKLKTNELEKTFAGRESFVPRPINLDPGYVCGSKLVLASTKDQAHRIYLGRGIYAEITLVYRKNRFSPLETTYRDYRTTQYIEFFTKVRQRHLLARERGRHR